MLLAYFLFSFVDTSTKWLLGAGMAVLQLAFLRYLTHALITLVDVQRLPARRPRLTMRLQVLVVLRAFCLVSATVANFIALGHLPLAMTSALLFLAPILVCLFAGILLGERITAGHWGAVALGFFGVVVLVNPFGEAINWYAVLMLYPATGMAFYAILTRKLAHRVASSVLQLSTGLVGSVLLLPAGVLAWQMPQTLQTWVLMLMLGVFAWAGHEALTRAHSFATASLLAPFGYSFVIYLSLAGWVFFNEIPDVHVALGAVIITAAGMLVWRLGNRAPTA